MNIFEEVKSHTDIRAAAEHYGLTLQNGMCSCPLHTDKTPSMKLYSAHFHCFSCGEHGDVIKLTQLILSCSPLEAAQHLASDFGIIIHNNRTQPKPTLPPPKRLDDREREQQAYRLLSDYCTYLEDCRTRYAPHTPEEYPHPLFVLSLHELELFRYYRDIFIFGDYDERKAFIKEHGKLFERLYTMFRKNAA